MGGSLRTRKDDAGFTLLQLIIIVGILGILASIAIPQYSEWMPKYRLKSAAMDIYSNMQLARLMAIKSNKSYRLIFFVTAGNGTYIVRRPDGTIEKRIDFRDYDPSGTIGYGGGNAIKSATKSGSPLPDDGISFNYNTATFNSRGTGSSGYVYIENSRGTAYAIGTLSSGVIVLKKWNDSANEWR